MQRDLQLGQAMGRVLTLLLDLQVLLGHRVPAAAMRRQLVYQLVLAGQRQAEARLAAMREAELAALAGAPLPTGAAAAPWPHRQKSLPQEGVQQLVTGGAVLPQYDDKGRAAHAGLQVLLLMAGEGNAAQLTWEKGEGVTGRKGRRHSAALTRRVSVSKQGTSMGTAHQTLTTSRPKCHCAEWRTTDIILIYRCSFEGP